MRRRATSEMTQAMVRVLGGMVAAIFLGGCGTTRNAASDESVEEVAESDDPAEPEKPELQPIHVGYVKLVREDSGFVLVRLASSIMLPSGQMLRARPIGSMSDEGVELRLSPERRPGFFVADIVDGVPGEGDFVFTDPQATPAGLGLTPLVQGELGGINAGEIPSMEDDGLYWPAFGDEIPDPANWGWKPDAAEGAVDPEGAVGAGAAVGAESEEAAP